MDQVSTAILQPPTAAATLSRSHAMAYVLAGGRGSRLQELTDNRAKPAVYFGGKSRIIDFALSNALNSGIRRISVATQYKAHSLIRHLQRGWNFFRPERNESFDILPASQHGRRASRLVCRHRRRGLPEHRHHRGLRAALHRAARRRPHLQDGLRADAAAARAARRRRDGRLHRGAADGSDRVRRDGGRSRRPHPGRSWRSRRTRPASPASPSMRWPAWASTCSRPSS